MFSNDEARPGSMQEGKARVRVPDPVLNIVLTVRKSVEKPHNSI